MADRVDEYEPGTLLRDGDGRYWLVRDDGQTAAGTNGGVMVDLRRGLPVFLPRPRAHKPRKGALDNCPGGGRTLPAGGEA